MFKCVVALPRAERGKPRQVDLSALKEKRGGGGKMDHGQPITLLVLTAFRLIVNPRTHNTPCIYTWQVDLAFKLDDGRRIRIGVRAVNGQAVDSVFVGCLWR